MVETVWNSEETKSERGVLMKALLFLLVMRKRVACR